jgi:hypothetical protein
MLTPEVQPLTRPARWILYEWIGAAPESNPQPTFDVLAGCEVP